jgi:hypothetical protein
VLPVALAKNNIEDSPPLAADEPVSRQHELELYKHFRWQPYWDGRLPGTMPVPDGEGVAAEEYGENEPTGDPHLRSVEEIIGYKAGAVDGDAGEIEDLIVDDEAWVIRYLVVDTGGFLADRKVIIATDWITDISWEEARAHTSLKRDDIKHSPEFDPKVPVNRKYEEVLYDYYGRPRYWD